MFTKALRATVSPIRRIVNTSRNLLIVSIIAVSGVVGIIPAGDTAAAAPPSRTVVTAADMSYTVQSVSVTSKQTLRTREAAKTVTYAYQHLGAKYRWGGNGPEFDCSGLSVAAWKFAGVSLHGRRTTDILAHGHRISRNHLVPGDLLFFYGVSHMGIYVGGGYMIHASSSRGQVIKTKLSYPGYSFWNYFDGAIRPGM